MSMTPITQTMQGQSLTFAITSLAALNAVLTTDALAEAFAPQDRTLWEAMGSGSFRGPNNSANPFGPAPTAALWAAVLATGGPAAASQIPPEQIRSVLAAALQGGGMSANSAIDTAEHIHRGQLNRSVDFLAAQIVQACIAAG